jgi:hypothetical protein
MLTNQERAGKHQHPSANSKSPATAVSRQFAPNLLDVNDLAIVTLRLEDFAQHLAYYALMVRPEGGISAVSLFSPVNVS